MLTVISTLGPKSYSENIITLLSSVSEVFRLNASHLTPMELNNILIILDKLYKKNNYKKKVVIDLKGAKIRIGKFPNSLKLPEIIYIKNIKSSDNSSIIPIENEEFFRKIRLNDMLYLNDATIILKVIDLKDDKIICSVLKNGELSSNKGINIKNHPIIYNNITEVDKFMIEIANKFDFTFFAFSFVLDGMEYDILKRYTDKKIIAKIERPEAIKFLENIDSKFDGIWFCRGDLGAQVGLENLGEIQYRFSKKIPTIKNEVYLAGQVLHSITKFSTPTRTEIVSLYQIKKEGYTGIVLSDETAVGDNIKELVKFLKLIR